MASNRGIRPLDDAPARAADAAPLLVEESTSSDDPAWDAFLDEIGASHTQSSLWSRAKATLGWHPLRVVARDENGIVGGAQVLYRPIAALGHVGYVANGPVLADPRPTVREQVIRATRAAALRQHVLHLTVQPARSDHATSARLAELGWAPTTTHVIPQATLLLDLTLGTDALLAAMAPRTRYNVRLAERRGVTVRAGDEADLDDFLRLLDETASRQRFVAPPAEHFVDMWRVLAPGGHARLALASWEGETVSAQLAIAFGQTVTNRMSVWSGRHGNHRPNEALQWDTIRWAAAQGYRWYDLEGIDVRVAQALLAGEPRPEARNRAVTSFKLGFGGQAVVAPPAHVYLPGPVLRWAYPRVVARLRGRRSIKRLERRLRTRATSTDPRAGGPS